jgi:glycerol dehydrogenase-like iron-containing ADH family enzyme
MTRIAQSPDRCVQGPGEIGRLHNGGLQLGDAFLVVANSRTLATTRGLVQQAWGVRHEEDED